jgi:hypothetical protein
MLRRHKPSCLRIAATALILATLSLAVPASAVSATRTYFASNVHCGVATFKLVGLKPTTVRAARVTLGQRRARVKPAVVRRAARYGMLRLRLSTLRWTRVRTHTRRRAERHAKPARRVRHTRCRKTRARQARVRRKRPKLTVTTSDPAKSADPTPSPSPTTSPGSGPLKWAPPAQSNPTTINVPVSGGTWNLAATQDATLVLPTNQVVTGRIQVNGGRHIRLIGGKMDGSGITGTSGLAAAALVFNDMGGPSPAVQPTVFIEGLHMDLSARTDKDLIWVGGWNSSTNRTTWARPRLYLQNSLLQGANWSGGSQHPDNLQKNTPFQGVKAYQVTSESVYQGFFLPTQEGPDASVGGGWAQGGAPDNELERANFRVRNETKVGYLLWLNWDSSASTSQVWPPVPLPHTLLGPDVWVNGRTTDTLANNLVWPRQNTVGVNGDPSRDVSLIPAGDGLSGTWRPDALIDGTIHKGTPPVGDFCPAGCAGLGYVSPGYL